MKPVLKFLPLVACVLTSGMVAAQERLNCTCRHQGVDYKLGEEVCLSGASGPSMARCEMVMNNTSWNFLDAPCPKTTQNNLNDPSESDFNRTELTYLSNAGQISETN